MGIEVDTAALKKAAQNFADTVTALVEANKTLIERGTHLPALSWGAIGAITVSGNYNPAADYQTRQIADFVKCLHGVNAGLYSVALHYDQAELANAQHAYDVAKDPAAKSAALTRVHDVQQKVTADTTDFDQAKTNDDSYH